MRKGVILEINDLYLTLLTPEGEFLRARKLQQDYQVGEEIHFFPETQTVKQKKFNLSFLNSFKARTIVFAAALMLVMTALVPAYQNGQVYAYMSIDVNPSIELAVNDDLKVLRMKGYNPEGEEIIGKLKGWKKKDAADVAEMILAEIEEDGFFKVRNDVVIATVHNKKAKESVDRELERKISEIKKSAQDEELNVKIMEATSKDREKARKQGVTTGVYKEKQKAQPEPAAKPVEKETKAKPEPKPEPAKKDTVPSVVPKPEKKNPPGQGKKVDPAAPNGKSNKEKPASDKGDRSKNNEKKHDGQGRDKHADKGSKKNNGNGQDGKKPENEKKPNPQQGPNSNNKGKAEKNKDNPGKK